jgi:hypothetical protein
MLQSEWSAFNITHLKPADIPNWENLSIFLVKRLNDTIPYIGSIKITSTYRPGDTGSAHSKKLAVDFKPLKRPLWHVYQIMRALGWQRIGIDPGQGIIHADIGEGRGYSYPYYFLEAKGKDVGALSKQAQTALAAIPGYLSPLTAVAAGKPITTPAGDTKILQPVAAGFRREQKRDHKRCIAGGGIDPDVCIWNTTGMRDITWMKH